MILMFDSVNWFNDILRPLVGGIDSLIYSLLSWIIEGIFNISSIMAQTSLLQILYNRIYIILSIYMVFKLTFSFLKYLVSPDAMSDKEQGVGKVIFRTIAMLALLIIFPVIFFETTLDPRDVTDVNKKPILYAIQEEGIQVIPRLVLGITESTTVSNNAKKNGDTMAIYMLRSFYFPAECDSDSEDVEKCSIISDNNVGNISQFINSLKLEGENDEYFYKYQWPLSTIVGIIMVVIMVGICIDIAIRAFKLIVLQMMAPIPIMTYMDPKSSKDGAFNSWLKTFISTYVDIFVKLLTVYLILLLISKLFSDQLFDGISDVTGFMSRTYVKVFLVIGLLKFAKDAPKFIKDALGIKDNGGGGGFMGKAAAGLAGAAAGFAGGVAAGGGLSGGLSGAAGGFSAGSANAGSGKKANIFGQTRDAQAKALGRPEGGLKGKIQQKALQGRVNKKTGLNAQTLDEAKDNMLKTQNEADIAEAGYNYKLQNGGFDDDAAAAEAYADLTEKKSKAAGAQRNYEKANKMADQIGLNKGFMDKKSTRSSAYRAVRDKIGTAAYDTDKGTGLAGKIDEKKENFNNRAYANIANGNGGIRDKAAEFVADNVAPRSIEQQSKANASRGGFDPNAKK